MIHVYYGDGKGKTTAALGLVLRATGYGQPCAVVQFLKDQPCGELEPLSKLGVAVLRGKSGEAMFTFGMSESALAETRRIHDENFNAGADMLRSGKIKLLVLDELTDALSLSLLDEQSVRSLLDSPPPDAEIVITGHAVVPWVFSRADYLTEMVKRAHPYDRGVSARKGVEF